MPSGDRGLSLVGEKIMVNTIQVHVTKLLGEGGFSYVYLCKDISDQSLNNTVHGGEATQRGSGGGNAPRKPSGGNPRRPGSMGRTDDREKRELVLKATAIISRQQRDIAEKEAKLLSRLSHPSIIKMHDACYRTVTQQGKGKERPQHLILMELCEGGHALDVCSKMLEKGEHFDLSTLIIAFGQICNAVSYLHAQRPPIVHRDLKPANFLIKNGAYKLCDFGSAVFGHVDLKTPEARAEAEEVIQKTTTQMFRAPEMVDLYVAKKLTQATDVWALGACLYSMAFLQDCFEEGSNLAILSRKYKIPDDNPYGDGLVELIDRMLTIDSKARSDMTEVILCLSAVYSGRPLPPRKERPKKEKKEKSDSSHDKPDKKKPSGGIYRPDSQGTTPGEEGLKKTKPKALNPKSAAGKRLALKNADHFETTFDKLPQDAGQPVDDRVAFTPGQEAFFDIAPPSETNDKNEEDKKFFPFDSNDVLNGDLNLKDAFPVDSNWESGHIEDSFTKGQGDGEDPNHTSSMTLDVSNSELDQLNGDGEGDGASDMPKKPRKSNGPRRPRRISGRNGNGNGKDENSDMTTAVNQIVTNDEGDENGTHEEGGGGVSEDKVKKPGRRVRRPVGTNPDMSKRRGNPSQRRSGSRSRSHGKESTGDDPAEEAEAEE